MKDGCGMAPHKLLLTKPACVDASQDGSREILNAIRSDPSGLQLAHAPNQLWVRGRRHGTGEGPAVDTVRPRAVRDSARQAGRSWLIFSASATICSAVQAEPAAQVVDRLVRLSQALVSLC